MRGCRAHAAGRKVQTRAVVSRQQLSLTRWLGLTERKARELRAVVSNQTAKGSEMDPQCPVVPSKTKEGQE